MIFVQFVFGKTILFQKENVFDLGANNIPQIDEQNNYLAQVPFTISNDFNI